LSDTMTFDQLTDLMHELNGVRLWTARSSPAKNKDTRLHAWRLRDGREAIVTQQGSKVGLFVSCSPLDLQAGAR
jgi:hypothetical protein